MAPVCVDNGRSGSVSNIASSTSQITQEPIDTKKYVFYKGKDSEVRAYVPAILKTDREIVDFFNSRFKGKELKNWGKTLEDGRRILFTAPLDCESPVRYYRENYESFYHYIKFSMSPKGKKGDSK